MLNYFIETFILGVMDDNSLLGVRPSSGGNILQAGSSFDQLEQQTGSNVMEQGNSQEQKLYLTVYPKLYFGHYYISHTYYDNMALSSFIDPGIIT